MVRGIFWRPAGVASAWMRRRLWRLAEPADRTVWARWTALATGGAGLVVALATTLGPLRERAPRPADGIATVDGRPVSRAAFQRAIDALRADKRNRVTDAEQRFALSRLVDEQLMVRRALDLGLAEAEPSVRKALVDVMIQFASAQAAGEDPSDAELRAFYDGRPALFAGEPLLAITAVAFPADAGERAQRMSSLLRAGTGFDAAVADTRPDAVPTPDGLSPARKIGEYAGATIRAASQKLSVGEAAGPIEVGGRHVFILVRERQQSPRAAFDGLRDKVLEEWRVQARERALEAYIATLRRRATITFAPDAPR